MLYIIGAGEMFLHDGVGEMFFMTGAGEMFSVTGVHGIVDVHFCSQLS